MSPIKEVGNNKKNSKKKKKSVVLIPPSLGNKRNNFMNQNTKS